MQGNSVGNSVLCRDIMNLLSEKSVPCREIVYYVGM
jgi:hypothetical protein